jgi:hypothetical protein
VNLTAWLYRLAHLSDDQRAMIAVRWSEEHKREAGRPKAGEENAPQRRGDFSESRQPTRQPTDLTSA